MTEEQRIEAAARALCIESGGDPDKLSYAFEMKCTGYDREPKEKWQYWIPFAHAAVAAYLAGDVVVPREATTEMIDAGLSEDGGGHDDHCNREIQASVYRAMVAARPTTPGPGI